jgi:ATP-binding cassette subfamily C (CFTR/MRP) protein 1
LSLLRILELQSGTIELDDIDIGRVGLDLLRQRCFITVSQDTLLLSNETLRFNLDPNASLPDNIIIEALERTRLWRHFSGNGIDVNGSSGLETNGNSVVKKYPVLDTKVSQFQELSGGQYQLLGLCRALIRANTLRGAGLKPVILLDEVTSSLDSATESNIHSIIEEEFTGKGHTVIIVAHRLGVLAEHTKPGRDVVVVMQDGRVQEIITDLTKTVSKFPGETS